jgi:ferric-dicitrate binding protein FerR (iron transport regulator)
MSDDRDTASLTWDAIERYVAGELPSAEAERIRVQLAANPEAAWALTLLQEEVDLAKIGGGEVARTWTTLSQRLSIASEAEEWHTTAQPEMRGATPSIGRNHNARHGARTPGKQNGMRMGARIVLAGAAFGVSLTVAIWQLAGPPPTGEAAAVRHYATASGQRASITLANGTHVTLSPGTRLDASLDARTGRTQVRLAGEAFFTVTAHSTHPFTVQTDRSVTRVLGTTFSVRAYPTEASTRIAVADGRVAVQRLRSHPAQSRSVREDEKRVTIVLASGSVGIVTDSTNDIQVKTASGTEYTERMVGKLIFVKTPVRDVVADLGRAYGVDLRVNDARLAQQEITWSVPTATQPLRDALDELPLLIDAHIIRVGTTITLVPGRKGRSSGAPAHPFPVETQYGR